jgi:hypothetical protein
MTVKRKSSRQSIFKNISKRVRSMGKTIANAFGESAPKRKRKVVRRKKKR